MSNKQLDCRAAAAYCLAKVLKGHSLNHQIPLFEIRVKERDRPLFKQLCYGVLRFYPRLSGISDQLLQKPLKPKDYDVLMLILLGIYQLTDETRIPEHAAISATVAATRGIKKNWAKGLVNGVLRQWQRNSQQLLSGLSQAQQLAHPDWLFNAINSAWESDAERIFQQNNMHPPMCLRVNSRFVTREDYLQLLQENKIEATPCEFSSRGIRLDKAYPVDNLPKFDEGWVSVQDEAAQLAANILSAQAGQRVLDACCAPGGKTCHILEETQGISELVALDVDNERLEKVSSNLSRLKLSATLACGDAANPDDWWDGVSFDRILLDAPCSATGVIRRNPDIKIHRQLEDIIALSNLQKQLLKTLWATLKPGGFMLYATCSILPDENEKVIQAFCQSNPQAEHHPIEASWGCERAFGRQLFPQHNGHDGFYYALLKKKH